MMKSWRLNKVAFSLLQGGHQLAPQYRSTGCVAFRAWAKARSMSASVAAARHAIELMEGVAASADLAGVSAMKSAAARANTARVFMMASILDECAMLSRDA